MRAHDREGDGAYDDRRLAPEPALRGWHGFRVDSPDGRIGVVERIYRDRHSDLPAALEIRVGLFCTQLRLAPIEWVAEVRPEERRIVLRAFPLDGHGHLGTPDGSDDWLRGLGAAGPIRRDAIASLHKLLLDAATFEVGRRRGTTPELSEDDTIGIAVGAAEDALIAVLSRLGDYAGRSRFTTWASKFALREAAVRMRRQAWRGRTVPSDAAGQKRPSEVLAGSAGTEHEPSVRAALQGVDDVLTRRESALLRATSIRQVPIDVLAEQLGLPRDDVYRIVQAARWKLSGALASRRLRRGQPTELDVARNGAGDVGPPPSRDGRRTIEVSAERPSGVAREPT